MGKMLLFCLLCTCVERVRCQSAEDVSRLHRDLYKVNSKVRPVKNFSTVTNVTISFHLMSINNFEMVNQKLTTNAWLLVTWQDEYMVWDPRMYNGTLSIFADPERVWKPKLTVLNTMKELRPVGNDFVVVMALSSGRLLWYPAEAFETLCQVDVTYFPFDTQRCQIQMNSWDDDVTDTNLFPEKPEIDLDSFGNNGQWDVVSTSAKRAEKILNNQTLPLVIYELTLRRRPSVLALTVLLPVMVLAVVNVYVFAIPAESGERLSFAITVLMSYGVFMGFITDAMPLSTETLPIIAVDISILLVLSAFYVLLCILNSQLFHWDEHKFPVPMLLAITILLTEKSACMGQQQADKNEVVPEDSGSGKTGDDGSENSNRMALGKDVNQDPAEMTWKRVSRTLDKFFFRSFLFLVLVGNITICIVFGTEFY